jgi:putative addiction module antidote
MAVNEVERKITKIGNSLGVTLPPEVVRHIGAEKGDGLNFELTDNGTVVLKKHKRLKIKTLEGVIDQEFLEGMGDLFDNYDSTLKNLVDR